MVVEWLVRSVMCLLSRFGNCFVHFNRVCKGDLGAMNWDPSSVPRKSAAVDNDNERRSEGRF